MTNSEENFFHIVTTSDKEWDDAYSCLPSLQKDPYFSPSYAKASEKYIFPNSKVLCAIQEFAGSLFMYPFVQRRIREVSGYLDAPDFLDIRGLYGRSGLAVSQENSKGQELFWSNFLQYCKEKSIITSFGRVHPSMKVGFQFQSTFVLHNLGSEVLVDTTKKSEVILLSAHHAIRKNYRKAESFGLKFRRAKSEDLIEIYNIYLDTLSRNMAQSFYRFPFGFFESLFFDLLSGAIFYCVSLEDQIISFEIVLVGGIFAHSFLGGTSSQFLKTQANTFLKISICRELNEMGVLEFYLGGGASDNDGILKYKMGFSPKNIIQSEIESSILDPEKYQQLKEFFEMRQLPINARRIQFYEI
jgi:hypothetical protein